MINLKGKQEMLEKVRYDDKLLSNAVKGFPYKVLKQDNYLLIWRDMMYKSK